MSTNEKYRTFKRARHNPDINVLFQQSRSGARAGRGDLLTSNS